MHCACARVPATIFKHKQVSLCPVTAQLQTPHAASQQLVQARQPLILSNRKRHVLLVHVECHVCPNVYAVAQQQPHTGQLDKALLQNTKWWRRRQVHKRAHTV